MSVSVVVVPRRELLKNNQTHRSANASPRVVDEKIDFPVGLHDLVGHLLSGVFVGEIGGMDVRHAALARNVLGHNVEFLLRSRHENHARPGFSKAVRQRLPDPVAAPRHHAYLVPHLRAKASESIDGGVQMARVVVPPIDKYHYVSVVVFSFFPSTVSETHNFHP